MSQSKRTRTRNPSVQNPEEIEQEVNQRPFHKEICFPEDPSNPFYNSIREAHLAGMIQRKTPGNATFVKHFYISAKRYQAMNRIGCRDKRVYFNSQRIKMFYELPTITECAYQTQWAHFERQPDDFPGDEVARLLVARGNGWFTKTQGGKKYLKRSELTPTARAWLHFVGHNVAPTNHFSEITPQLAFLIYLFMKNEPVRVEDLIFHSLWKSSVNGIAKQAIIFPHLISQMYINARVGALPTDLMFEPEAPKIYSRFGFREDEDEVFVEERAPAAVPQVYRRKVRPRIQEESTSRPPQEEQQLTIEAIAAKLDQILRNQEHAQENFQSFRSEVRDQLQMLQANQLAIASLLQADLPQPPMDFGHDSQHTTAGTRTEGGAQHDEDTPH